MKRKIYCILLSLAMVLAMMPVATFADVANEEKMMFLQDTVEETMVSEIDELAKQKTLQYRFVFTNTGITVYDANGVIASSEVDSPKPYDGTDFTIDDTDLTIDAAGEFTLSGSCTNGSVLVPKYEKQGGEDDREIELKMDNLDLTTLDKGKCPLQLKGNNDITITAVKNSENVLTDDNHNGEKPKSCINASETISLEGEGKLTVNGNNKNGIKSDKKIKIKGIELFVYAVDDGIAADKEVSIKSGKVSVVAGEEGHGIASKPDEIDKEEDGTTQNGNIVIEKGTLDIKAGKDGIHADGTLCVESGDITIECGDDALHGSELMQVGKEVGDSGKPVINIKKAYEGIEGKVVEIRDGDITIRTSDDCINASLGSDTDNDAYHPETQIYIKGGKIDATCTGNADVIDSNGDIHITGGNLLLYCTASWHAPIDAAKTIHIEGATIFAGGNMSRLMYKPDKTSQNYLFKTKSYKAGSKVNVGDNGELVTYELKQNVKSVLYTSPTLKKTDDFVTDVDAWLAKQELKLAVNPLNNNEDQYKIYWQKISGKYYLFLPADCDRSDLTVYFNRRTEVTVNSKKITNGEKTDTFAEGKEFTVACGDKKYPLTVMQSSNISSMYITTADGEMDKVNKDKSYKTKGKISIASGGNVVLNTTIFKSIKGRGNSTWSNPKKPYNIKFDSKTSILGMDQAKKWTLLACYSDVGLLHNPLAWEVAKDMKLPFSSDYRFVDLYINNEYNGTYIVCESIEVGNNRVNITDLTDATEEANGGADLETYSLDGEGNHGAPSLNWVDIPNNPEDITGGYLLECDYHSREAEEVSGFITTRGQAVTLKDPEYASEDQVRYISQYWQEAEDAISSEDGYNSLGKHYSDYFDMDALVNMYVFLEMSGDTDAGLSSTYFYKDKGDKLVAGPIWDNDKAFGYCKTRGGYFINDPSIWWAGKRCYGESILGMKNMETPTVFNWLYRHDEFRKLAAERWHELRNSLSYETMLEHINANDKIVRNAAMMNGVRWDQMSSDKDYEHNLNMTKNYLKSRIKYLDKGFSKRAVHVFYDANGGKGWINEMSILTEGDKILVRDAKNANLNNVLGVTDARSIEELIEILKGNLKAPKKGLKFIGWNTKKDGTGRTYQPGDIVRVRKTMTLYAQWGKTAPELDKANKRRVALYDSSLSKTIKSLFSIIKAGAI